jgi:hypothetical protein
MLGRGPPSFLLPAKATSLTTVGYPAFIEMPYILKIISKKPMTILNPTIQAITFNIISFTSAPQKKIDQ